MHLVATNELSLPPADRRLSDDEELPFALNELDIELGRRAPFAPGALSLLPRNGVICNHGNEKSLHEQIIVQPYESMSD